MRSRKMCLNALAAVFAFAAVAETVTSPDGRLSVGFDTGSKGMSWSLVRDGKAIVAPSSLGFAFSTRSQLGKDVGSFAPMKVLAVRRRTADSTWTTRLSRREINRDHYNEMAVELEETEPRALEMAMGETTGTMLPRRLTIVFRAYDEGAAFRYVFPEQAAIDHVVICRELTEWRFAADAKAWMTAYPAEFTSQEEPFVKREIATMDAKAFIGMPVVVETQGTSVALCEAALSDWAGLFYRAKGLLDGKATLGAWLTQLPKSEAAEFGVSVIRMTPAASPWRVAIVGDDGIDLMRKNGIIENLNPEPDPSIDFSFVKPGPSSWDWWVESNNSLSTALTLQMVDFAAEMGWPYHTIDGGWYGFYRRPNHGPNVPLQPRRDFDLDRIVRHAKEKGVGIWVWIHWEEINDIGIEETFSRLEKWGVKGVKTDFLNRQDQWIVQWYERVCRAAAKHRIMVNFHGAHHPSGTERTWPNNLTREGILGNEMNIFHRKITPAHCATLPFTRFLIGPGDFTPGSFANRFSKDFIPQVKTGHRYGDETDRCPHWAEEMGTRAHAIAQCIAFDSRLMTLCDWPERYRNAPGVEALRKLPAAWRRTIPLEGVCGEYYAVLREAFDGRFFYAATTVKGRNLELALDFLGDGDWQMQVFADDTELTPGDAKAIALATRKVKKGEKIGFTLVNEGGAVAIFTR